MGAAKLEKVEKIFSNLKSNKTFTMYSMYSKKENAHDEAGWCCAWGRYEPSEEAMDTGEDPENGGENKENEEDPTKKSPPEPREAAITGGVDDIVRVWSVSDGELRLKNILTDHSLGVVAVDINKEVTKARMPGTEMIFFIT